MKTRIVKHFVLLVSLTLFCCGVAKGEVTHLRCEYLDAPVGIDVLKPRLSWIFESSRRGASQIAYQIIVASTADMIDKDQGDLWNSGKVESSHCALVEYGGKALTSRERCFWKVRVWDETGKASQWSKSSMWSMGFLDARDWRAQWIGWDEVSSFEKARWIWSPGEEALQNAAPGSKYFRRNFVLPDAVKMVSAVGTVTADNAFELSLNGQKIACGDDWTRPVRFEAASFLRGGTNVFSIVATNVGNAPSPAGVLFSVCVKLSNGETLKLVSDDQWESSQDQKTWMLAKVLGDYGVAPWGKIEAINRELPARYLRREFQVEKKVQRATAYVCGLGFFDLFVNGTEVSDHVMDPALSDYDKTAYYVTFDVTRQLRSGSNAVGVALGNGRYFTPRTQKPAQTIDYGYPKLLMQLEVEYADGSKEIVCTDNQWRLTTEGPIRLNNEYDGEEYDARMEMPGWDCPGFDDSKWHKALLVNGPKGRLRAQMIEPMRVTEIVRPVTVTCPAPGVQIFDMGQNFYGTFRITASAPRGTEVRFVSAYSLKPDGTLKTADNREARCTDVYVFKGEGIETWSPRFKGQGFRRVQITGLPKGLRSFEGLVIHTDVEFVGEFECSNELVNRIHQAMRWGMRMFLRSAPLDPDRDERQAWMGDPSKDSESEAFNFNVASFYAKWMDDVRASQRNDGSIPDVAAYWVWGDGVEWPSVFTIIPDWMADFYGDDSVVKRNYESMKKWVLAMRRHELPNGTLKGTSYGDWCDASSMDEKVSDNGATPRELVSSAYQYHNYRIMERWAERFGKAEDKAEFGRLAGKLGQAFNEVFYDSKTHTYKGDTQCAYVLALQFGLVPEKDRNAVISNLVDNILVKHNGHLSVGLIGQQWILQTLTEIGRPDVAWTIVTQTTRPSWGYMIGKGATTIWERWDMDTRSPGMNSEALLIQAGNGDAWFYQTLAGINFAPQGEGFRRIEIHPHLLGDLTWVKAHFDSPCGRIVSEWRRNENRLKMCVVIPPSVKATIYVPAKSADVVFESGHLASNAKGLRLIGYVDGNAVFEAVSGKYEFTAEK